MEIVFTNHKIDEEEINLTIHHNQIIGLINDRDNTIFDLISLKTIGRGQISINNEKITKDDLFITQKRISTINDNIDFPPFIHTVKELMEHRLIIYNLNVKNPTKKIKDSLKIVGLSDKYLERENSTLSPSEKKLILLAISLLSNPDTIIIEEPFKYLDMRQEKRLMLILQKFKEQYNKTIILKSDDTETLYKYADEVIVVKNRNILLSGLTKEVFQRVDYLKRNGITIPQSVMFTYLAKKHKDAKIDYHRDIRDIIKDIYKHV